MRFAGYAALFNRTDRGGDIIRAGAFAGARAPLPIYREHDARRRIGTVEMLGEDARGLRVIGRVDTAVEPGTGLSFGYRPVTVRHGTNRELTAVELIEVSLVRRPMQPLARVHATDPS